MSLCTDYILYRFYFLIFNIFNLIIMCLFNVHNDCGCSDFYITRAFTGAIVPT